MTAPAVAIRSGAAERTALAVAAVVLAAGESRRLGQPKQLARFAGEPLVLRTVRAVLEAGAAPVVVVVGAFADAVGAALAPLAAHEHVHVVEHAEWAAGLGSSLAAGVARVYPGTGVESGGAPAPDAVLVALADQPLVDADAYGRLVGAFRDAAPSVVAAAAAYGDVVGAPAVFRRAWLAALCATPLGDRGAGALLRSAAPGAVVRVPTPGAAVDVDTPADLDRLAAAEPPRPAAR